MPKLQISIHCKASSPRAPGRRQQVKLISWGLCLRSSSAEMLQGASNKSWEDGCVINSLSFPSQGWEVSIINFLPTLLCRSAVRLQACFRNGKSIPLYSWKSIGNLVAKLDLNIKALKPQACSRPGLVFRGTCPEETPSWSRTRGSGQSREHCRDQAGQALCQGHSEQQWGNPS